MVFIAPLVGAAVFLSGLTAALPARRDSSYSGSSSNSGYSGSSGSSSNYGSSNSNSYGGSSDSNSNYGGSNYGGNNYDTSSTEEIQSTSTQGNNYGGGYGGGNNYYTTSSTEEIQSTSTQGNNYGGGNNYYTSSTEEIQSTSTMTTSMSYQTSNYGSGSSNWGGSGYQDCVNQCIASYGGMSGGGSYQATATSGSYGSSGNGATHTVIVAPTKGVFRFMPFATNASVGDTIEFHWGADNHTVTKSSELLPCNKSAEAPVFASGEQNENFVFRQVVNDTNPTFYYCGTPTHCEKGMFGVINPQMATPGSPTSLGGMMSSMAANDSDLSAYAAYSQNVTANNDVAAEWGTNFEMANMPDWSRSLMATNVLFTRATFGMNPDTLNADGSSNLASVATTPLMIPMDISGALNAASASTAASTPVANAAAAAATTSAAPSASTTAKPSSAMALASPKMLVGVVVVLATIFAL